eukprot:TRINITY_DN5430_c0_g1_i1.p1 TRINITY_DN5430_c0_g1~~TRINITY_DN5430_c0_g1_i1.p1  ORF type:complete len:632 (+),score=29.88 TRINITY_DN5430_c0_g1_i1:151-2046(+)
MNPEKIDYFPYDTLILRKPDLCNPVIPKSALFPLLKEWHFEIGAHTEVSELLFPTLDRMKLDNSDYIHVVAATDKCVDMTQTDFLQHMAGDLLTKIKSISNVDVLESDSFVQSMIVLEEDYRQTVHMLRTFFDNVVKADPLKCHISFDKKEFFVNSSLIDEVLELEAPFRFLAELNLWWSQFESYVPGSMDTVVAYQVYLKAKAHVPYNARLSAAYSSALVIEQMRIYSESSICQFDMNTDKLVHGKIYIKEMYIVNKRRHREPFDIRFYPSVEGLDYLYDQYTHRCKNTGLIPKAFTMINYDDIFPAHYRPENVLETDVADYDMFGQFVLYSIALCQSSEMLYMAQKSYVSTRMHLATTTTGFETFVRDHKATVPAFLLSTKQCDDFFAYCNADASSRSYGHVLLASVPSLLPNESVDMTKLEEKFKSIKRCTPNHPEMYDWFQDVYAGAIAATADVPVTSLILHIYKQSLKNSANFDCLRAFWMSEFSDITTEVMETALNALENLIWDDNEIPSTDQKTAIELVMTLATMHSSKLAISMAKALTNKVTKSGAKPREKGPRRHFFKSKCKHRMDKKTVAIITKSVKPKDRLSTLLAFIASNLNSALPVIETNISLNSMLNSLGAASFTGT